MNRLETELLMKLQYEFPLSPTPFRELGKAAGLSEDETIRRVRGYLEEGIVIRMGLQVNYRSLDESVAALVALKVRKDAISEAAKTINSTRGVRHNYLRDCEKFNVWFTIKAESLEELDKRVIPIIRSSYVEDWVVLPTKRVYKLNVRYDLHRGISWSQPTPWPEHAPSIEELGLDMRLLTDLEGEFKPRQKPFKPIADKYGLSEEDLISLINKLMKLGVVESFRAILSPEMVGFVENAMVVLKIASDEVDAICSRLVKGFPQITHCIERGVSSKWDYPAYVMLHARERAKILEVVDAIRGVPGVSEARPIFSLANLRESR
jgi:DNA-binding Lrp family transcriptional regulator